MTIENLSTPYQSIISEHKVVLAQQIQTYFYLGKKTECLKALWECYQIAPYFLPIQPFVRHFKKELNSIKMYNQLFSE